MGNSPSFIVSNRHGTYYFRLVIPARFRGHWRRASREIRRSLHTKSKSDANIRARAMRVEVDTLFQRLDEAMTKKTKNDATIRTELIKVLDALGNRFEIDTGNLQDDVAAATALQANIVGLTQASVSSALSVRPESGVVASRSTTTLLSALSSAFLDVKSDRRRLTPGTIKEYRAAYEELIYVLGDRVVEELRSEDAEAFYDALLRLPRNRKSFPEYAGCTATKLLQDAVPADRRRDTASANKIFGRVKGLLEHAVSLGHISKNPAQSVTLRVETRRARAKREPFTTDELRKIFQDSHFLKNKWRSRTKPEPYRFWLLPIALMTGARQSEICQLRKVDVVHDELADLWYFDIDEEFDAGSGKRVRSVKNENSIRKVPVSQLLIDMGLLDFVDHVRTKELFPELTGKADGIDAAQKWVNRFLQTCGVHQASVKTFHSLRHTFVNHLINKSVSATLVGAVTGHLSKEEFGGVVELAATYFKGYAPELLKREVIDKLDYADIVAGVHWSPKGLAPKASVARA